jgi:hypothetical protein
MPMKSDLCHNLGYLKFICLEGPHGPMKHYLVTAALDAETAAYLTDI